MVIKFPPMIKRSDCNVRGTSRLYLAEMATEIELGHAFLESLIKDHVAGKDIISKVSMAKYRLTDTAEKIAGDCMQLHGG